MYGDLHITFDVCKNSHMVRRSARLCRMEQYCVLCVALLHSLLLTCSWSNLSRFKLYSIIQEVGSTAPTLQRLSISERLVGDRVPCDLGPTSGCPVNNSTTLLRPEEDFLGLDFREEAEGK